MSIIPMPGTKLPPRKERSKMDTMEITAAWVSNLILPPFQRPLRVNEKVRTIAADIKEDGIIPGVITIGVIDRESYLIDGQHRIEAFKQSGAPKALCDLRICEFESMKEMGQEFFRLNSAIVRMRPDDMLRALKGSIPAIERLEKRAPFIGFDNIRRNEHAPVLSMSVALRMWVSSTTETPSLSVKGVVNLAEEISSEQVDQYSDFLNLCLESWGRDAEYARLWQALNLMICCWLYRRTVLGGFSVKSTRLTREQFRQGLVGLSADPAYSDWLIGRKASERDRSPCYSRIKQIFISRLQGENGLRKIIFPAPAWTLGYTKK